MKNTNHKQETAKTWNINLPLHLLNACNDKEMLQAVSVSVFIKAQFGDSRLVGLNIRNIKSFFGVGQNTAKKIIGMLKTNTELFQYNPNNDSVVAKTFKSYATETTDKHGRYIKMMYSVRLKVQRMEWSLKDLKKYIHDRLYINAINATERNDKFKACKELKNNILSATKEALTFSKMANIGGVCKSTAKRHIDRLEKQHEIKIKRGFVQVAVYSMCREMIEEAGLQNIRLIVSKDRKYGLVIKPNEYSISDRRTTESFRNIIFNHSRRMTHNISWKNVDFFDMAINQMFN